MEEGFRGEGFPLVIEHYLSVLVEDAGFSCLRMRGGEEWVCAGHDELTEGEGLFVLSAFMECVWPVQIFDDLRGEEGWGQAGDEVLVLGEHVGEVGLSFAGMSKARFSTPTDITETRAV